jgi:hypothetical protein
MKMHGTAMNKMKGSTWNKLYVTLIRPLWANAVSTAPRLQSVQAGDLMQSAQLLDCGLDRPEI